MAVTKLGGGRGYPPNAFTEHRGITVANVLNSSVAIVTSVQVVRAFVQLRRMLATHEDLARKLAALVARYDSQFRAVFDAIRKLITPSPEEKRRPVGYLAEGGAGSGGLTKAALSRGTVRSMGITIHP